MSTEPPIPLTAALIELDSPEFEAISGWPFQDPYVGRLLNNDIPQRVVFGNCRIWTYRDPEGRLVGFGTLDICDDCREYTGGKLHPYIPLLAINPTIKSRGYGTSIVRNLIDEAALFALRGSCHDVLFLDVYTTNERAIRVYTDCGFVTVSPQPIPDPNEGGQTYVVMARRVSMSAATVEPPS
jgi:ribosomal protein S18 acetylase RimI-like enzyme